MNDNLILVSGKSSTGKSFSLKDLKNPEGVLYLNCESGKKLPFKNNFISHVITEPLQIYEGFNYAETKEDIHTIVIDSLTFMMSLYQTYYIDKASNGLKAWGEYASYFKKLMSNYVAKSSKNVIFTAHTSDVYNETDLVTETMVKVSGSLMNYGIESFFSTVISSKKVPIKFLEGKENDLLKITDAEKILKFKYVFQVNLTAETVNERIRSAMGLWNSNETFIDNNIQNVIERLTEYYA